MTEGNKTNALLNNIFLGEVASVQNYGAFVKIPGSRDQGLVHRSQVSKSNVEDVSEVLQRGESVWCKVISITDDNKIALSMKVVDQGNGRDLDPNGVQIQQDEQRRRSQPPGWRRQVIQLDAVFNTTCSKCGTPGHLASDCFRSLDGKTYELLTDDDLESSSVSHYKQACSEEKTVELKTGDKKKKKKKKKHKKEKESKKKKRKKKRELSSSSSSSSSSSDTSTSDSSDQNENKKKSRKRTKSHSSSHITKQRKLSVNTSKSRR